MCNDQTINQYPRTLQYVACLLLSITSYFTTQNLFCKISNNQMWHYKVHCILQFPPSTSQTISCNLDKVQQFTCKMHQTKFSKQQNNYTFSFWLSNIVKKCSWNLQKQKHGMKSWLFHWTYCLLYMYNAVFTFSYKYYTNRYLEYFKELTSFLKIQQGYQIQIALFSMGN